MKTHDHLERSLRVISPNIHLSRGLTINDLTILSVLNKFLSCVGANPLYVLTAISRWI